MEGKKVEVVLHTAILVPEEDETKKNPYLEPVLKIHGVVQSFTEVGITLEIKECLTDKNQKLSPPRKNIFLPHHKIDHVFII
jgi:hypothetical protein